MTGAAIAFLPLPSRTLVLAIAVAIIGVRILREARTTEPRTAKVATVMR